jgi:hypothetical protein
MNSVCVERTNKYFISPATAALNESLQHEEESLKIMRSRRMMVMSLPTRGRHRPMISSTSLKRSRSPSPSGENGISNSFRQDIYFSSFEMRSFFQASRDVEDAMWFPPISWPSPSGDSCTDNDNTDDQEGSEPWPKRQCRGLLRSKNSSDLASLVKSCATARFGSNGSIC